MIRVSLIMLISALSAFCTIIPDNLRYTWQGNVGIPGGITNRSVIFCNVLVSIPGTNRVAVGDDVSDDTIAIQTALNLCPPEQVVYIPTGTYKVTSELIIKGSYTMRGDGPTNTVIDAHGTVFNSSIIKFGNTTPLQYEYYLNAPTATQNIVSGASKDDISIVVASATGITNGCLLNIDQLNDSSDGPIFVTSLGNEGYQGNASRGSYSTNDGTFSGTAGPRLVGQVVKVTGVSGTTISFDPPLFWWFTNSPQAVSYPCFIQYAGVENLQVYANNSGYGSNFDLWSCYACWVKNVESNYADSDHLICDGAVRCEVRDSYFHDGFHHGPGTGDDCIKARSHSSGCLFENNIIRRTHAAFMFLWGGGGHVVGYNYITNGFDESATQAFMPELDFHGGHVMMCLYEGNVANNVNQDGVWGSASHCTFLRNFFSGANRSCQPRGPNVRGAEQPATYTTNIDGIWIVNLAWNTRYFNVVGNVMGCTNTYKQYNGSTFGWTFMTAGPYATDNRGWDSTPSMIWTLGYADLGQAPFNNNIQPLYTLINHGNWDAVNNGITYSNNIADHVIPQSYYLPSKPAFFGVLSYPPIDPTTALMNDTFQITNVPAVFRFQTGSAPPSSATVASSMSLNSATMQLNGATMQISQ